MEAEFLHAQRDLSQTDTRVSGTVRVAAPDGLTTYFLCRQLAGLRKRHPSLTIQLVPMTRGISLSKREADVAITIERPAEGNVMIKRLIDYSLHFYASKDYLRESGTPNCIGDFARHSLVSYVQDLMIGDQLNFMPNHYGAGYSRFECSSAIGQIAAVRAGAGIGILHDYAAFTVADLEVVLPDISFDRSYWMATHSDLVGLSRVKVVTDFISRKIASHKATFRPVLARLRTSA